MKIDRRHPDAHFLAWARLLRAHKGLLERVQKSLSEQGMPPLEWYDLLLELDLADHKRLRLNDLGDRMVLSRSNLTRLCDRLEKEGLLAREKCEEDRRGLYASITLKGSELRREMWPVYNNAVNSHFSEKLSDSEAELLARLLLNFL